MKNNMKRLLILALTAMVIVLSACGSVGMIRQQTLEESGMTAYLYSRKTDGKKEYCMSLLESNETLDMTAEPNVHKSKYEFDFDYDKDMIMVLQHKKETPISKPIEIGDILVIFGQLYKAN
ncbi:MAG: hypothetical protein IKB60_02840 [Clostridia bacterium]|nr:hypothetical protein [Clostridia bacterium]